MKIHKEGNISILITLIIVISIVSIVNIINSEQDCIHFLTYIASILLLAFIIQFFKYKPQKFISTDNKIIAPAQGQIVVIEEVYDALYFKANRIQVSIFMSIWDTHLNRAPIAGEVVFSQYFPGKHLIARYPKSSEMNEQNVFVIDNKNGTSVLVKQIAGIMARRIVPYIKKGEVIKQGQDIGFIKFGSRVDLLLPKEATINVKLGQKVNLGESIIATL